MYASGGVPLFPARIPAAHPAKQKAGAQACARSWGANSPAPPPPPLPRQQGCSQACLGVRTHTHTHTHTQTHTRTHARTHARTHTCKNYEALPRPHPVLLCTARLHACRCHSWSPSPVPCTPGQGGASARWCVLLRCGTPVAVSWHACNYFCVNFSFSPMSTSSIPYFLPLLHPPCCIPNVWVCAAAGLQEMRSCHGPLAPTQQPLCPLSSGSHPWPPPLPCLSALSSGSHPWPHPSNPPSSPAAVKGALVA